VKGASAGEGLGNKFLTNIRETDAIAEVVRIFEDDNIIHVANKVNPLADIEVINLELILADLDTVSKRLSNLKSEIKKGDKKAVIENDLLGRMQKVLEGGKLAQTISATEEEQAIIKSLHLLTTKPILYVLNKKAGGKNLDEMNDERYAKLIEFIKSSGSGYVVVDAAIEQDLKDMEGEERAAFRKELSAGDDGINALIKAGYDLLGLMTYFTTGEQETRAWTIHKGWTAPLAGTAIHTDFKDKFVRAEVIAWDKLLEAGSFAAAKEKGWLRTEGKEYVVQDGDVIEFKI